MNASFLAPQTATTSRLCQITYCFTLLCPVTEYNQY